MTATPYPFPRETRESTKLVGNGTPGPYGPSTFKIFDTADVVVLARAAGKTFFSDVTLSATVTKSTEAAFDTFSVTFAENVPPTTDFILQSRRVHRREVAVTKGGAMDALQLEKELSKQGTILSELRRDINRAVMVEPGEPTVKIKPGVAGHLVKFDVDGNMVDAGISGSDLATIEGMADIIGTVAGISVQVVTVAGIAGDVPIVSAIAPAVSTVAANDANVSIVGSNIVAVGTVATNIAAIIAAPAHAAEAQAAEDGAVDAKIAAEAAAASISLPVTASRYIRRNAAGTAYEALTAQQSANLDELRDINPGTGGSAVLEMATAGDIAAYLGAVTLINGGLDASGATAGNDFNHGHFGGSFNAAKALHCLQLDKVAVDATVGPRFAVAITSEVAGGHLNGPADARGALWLFSGKKNYLSTTQSGEVDGAYILIQQGNKDDAGGILIGAYKVFGGTGDSGGLTPIEISSVRVNPAGTPTNLIQSIVGFQEGVGGALKNAGAGFYTEARVNANNYGFAAVHFGAAFKAAFAAFTDRNPASGYFSVYYDGHANLQLGSATDNFHMTFDFANDALLWRDQTSAANLLSLTKAGVLSAYAGMSVANGSVTIKRMFAQKSSVNFGTIAANAANTADVSVPGALVDDAVHVNATTNYSGDTEIITGRVLSNGVVRLSANNNGSSPLVTAAQHVIIWIFGK